MLDLERVGEPFPENSRRNTANNNLAVNLRGAHSLNLQGDRVAFGSNNLFFGFHPQYVPPETFLNSQSVPRAVVLERVRSSDLERFKFLSAPLNARRIAANEYEVNLDELGPLRSLFMVRQN